jgi:peptidoglycan-N-acetylglucosamine deacetylase
MKFIRWFTIISFTLFQSCDFPQKELSNMGGVAISFDDYFIEEWRQLGPMFAKHGAKVTFFATIPDALPDREVRILSEFEAGGHEIGFHGTIHGNAQQLLQQGGVNNYLNTEIKPGLNFLKKAGFTPISYAHPGGNRTDRTDSILLKQGFTILRDVAKNERSLLNVKLYHISPKYMPHIFYRFDGDKTVDALLIDTDVNISKAEIKEALLRAKQTGTTLMLFGHKPLLAEPKAGEYGFRVSFLKYIVEQADSLGLRFYTMSELPRISAQRP